MDCGIGVMVSAKTLPLMLISFLNIDSLSPSEFLRMAPMSTGRKWLHSSCVYTEVFQSPFRRGITEGDFAGQTYFQDRIRIKLRERSETSYAVSSFCLRWEMSRKTSTTPMVLPSRLL